jgi:hypothetical protein
LAGARAGTSGGKGVGAAEWLASAAGAA